MRSLTHLLITVGVTHAWIQHLYLSRTPTRLGASSKPDFSLPDDDPDNPKLGIDLSEFMDPLSEQEAAELKAAATEVVNDAVAAGIDDITRLREKLKKEIVQQQKASELRSEAKAKVEGDKLLNKIDQLTGDFLQKTEASRTSTKRSFTADQASIGKGIELGSWGTIGGTTVVATGDVETSSPGNKVMFLADTGSDPYAKQLVGTLTAELESIFAGSDFETCIYKPTDTIPLGGDGAAAVVLFCTSFSSSSSVKTVLDRAFRRTLMSGAMQEPPSQLVVVSTVGTSRTNQMPYSMQNMMGGGKLEQRRQMEEGVVRLSQERGVDYTVCKLGSEIKATKSKFESSPFDTIDGSIDLDTAVTVLSQSIATRATARNATICCAGSLDSKPDESVLDEAFLKLDGPEVYRVEGLVDYNVLIEYIVEWARLLADTGKGLTTPVKLETNIDGGMVGSGVQEQVSLQLLYLPTATGKNYLSKDEERRLEKEGSKSVAKPLKKMKKEGGLEFSVERYGEASARIRVKRCNYADDAVVKEITEETILSRFRKSIDVWKKEHPN